MNDVAGLEELGPAWTRLDEERPDAHVASLYPMAFAGARWRRSGEPWRCYVTTDRNGAVRQALFGVLGRQRLKGGHSADCFTVGTEHVSSVARAPDATCEELHALLDAVRGECPGRLIVFDALTAPELDALRAVAAAARWMHAVAPAGEAYWFETRGSFADLTQRMRAKFRRNLRRDWKRVTEAYRVEFESSGPVGETESLDHLRRFIEIEATGWKGRQGTSLGTIQGDYYREIVRCAAADGRMCWFRLLADGRPIAMYLCYRHHRTVWAMKTAYDEAFASYSPGNALLLRMLEYLCDEGGVDRLHMLTSPAWLAKWKPRREPYYRLRLFPPSLHGRLLHVAERVLGYARSRGSG